MRSFTGYPDLSWEPIRGHRLLRRPLRVLQSSHPQCVLILSLSLAPDATILIPLDLFLFRCRRRLVEEMALVKFFGDDYIKYRAEVPTRILFIS